MAQGSQQEMKVFRSASLSFPRRRESREVRWITAFAGMTDGLSPNLSDFVIQKVYPLGYLVESKGDLDDHLLIQRKPKG